MQSDSLQWSYSRIKSIALDKGEEDQTVETVKKVTAAQEMSISDMETDDEVCNMQFLLLLCVFHDVHNIK
jgi:hypothetical protein